MILWLDFSVFPISGRKRWSIVFFNRSLGCTSKLFPIHERVAKDRLCGKSLRHGIIAERGRGTQFEIKLPVFKKKICLYFYNNLSHFKTWEYCFQAKIKLKITKFSWCGTIWNKLHLFAYTSLCSESSG